MRRERRSWDLPFVEVFDLLGIAFAELKGIQGRKRRSRKEWEARGGMVTIRPKNNSNDFGGVWI